MEKEEKDSDKINKKLKTLLWLVAPILAVLVIITLLLGIVSPFLLTLIKSD